MFLLKAMKVGQVPIGSLVTLLDEKRRWKLTGTITSSTEDDSYVVKLVDPTSPACELRLPPDKEVNLVQEVQEKPSLKYCPNCETVYCTSRRESCTVRSGCCQHRLIPVTS